jgi:2-polyprenyl-3-methyl-5-hydroxy-6-metoxy-1,4-benzoquinol methylase
MRALSPVFEEIASRLPWRVRHALFVLYQKPIVIRSLDSSLELNKRLLEKSRKRWIHSEPDDELTWGEDISGDNFVRKAFSYNVFGSDKAILEVGPGKGRILKSLILSGIPYKKYLGIDISTKNIEYLRDNFSSAKHNFIEGNIETVELEENFDIMLSSLTFKHLFPSFKKALFNVSKYMNPDAMVFFDLPEGKLKCFHRDAYIRWYSRSEVKDILRECNLKTVTFDYVKHTAWHKRRLFVAAKP